MNRQFVFFTGLIALLFIGSACKPDQPQPNVASLLVTIEGFHGQDEFATGQEYSNHMGLPYTFERFRMLLSDVRLVKEDGTEEVFDSDLLVDLASNDLISAEGSVPRGNNHLREVGYDLTPGVYKQLKFNVGVPANRNNGNPADYQEDHPLSIRQGLHWTWSSGYIFLQIDGRLDSTGTGGSYNQAFVYHAGTNELLREVTIELGDFTLEDQMETQLYLHVDARRAFFGAFDMVDMVQDNFTHSTPAGSEDFKLAEQVINNFSDRAFSASFE